METIKSIFNNKLFRIPDYQRGYSWEKTHLDDFWQDLMNLQQKKVHYTGMISVEAVEEDESSQWLEDDWIIQGKGDAAYFVVDGQQRLTTIIILIWVICTRMEEGSQISYQTKQEILTKYIFTENKPENQKSYLFGYHKDNPSYAFLKEEIFEQKGNDSGDALEQTVYTNNLLRAKKIFLDKTKKFNNNDLQILFDKITQQLKFDFKILEKELDIFIVFETMNNRGKPLSNLERLKNRLIYLSTMLVNESSERKVKLRDDINNHWKIIYKYLGLNKDQKLDDDLFLQNHWIMFKRYERGEPEFYASDIFDKYFTSQNVSNGDENYLSISNYINSISESAKQWFIMNNPAHHHATEIASSKQIITWLKKINRLGFKSFAPLIMGSLVIEENADKTAKLLKSIEAYIFLIFDVSFRRSNTGTYHFNAKASELYNKDITIDTVIIDINYWIYGKNDYKGYFDTNSFYSFLKDLFLRENTNGYYDWKFLKYFLFEYELSLKSKYGIKAIWNDLNSVQHIYPNKPLMTCWKQNFKNYNAQQRKFLSGSLGNFVLVSKNVDVNECFDDKKSHYVEYANSYTLQYVEVWSKEQITERGLEMLSFMEKRWNVNLGSLDDKIKLLFLDFDSNITNTIKF